MQWDSVQQELAEAIAIKYGISIDKAKGIIEFYLKSNSRHIRKYEPVVVVNIGLFYLDPRKTNRTMLKLFKVWRAGLISQENFEAGFAKYMPLHSKARTHFPGTGIKYRMNKYFKNKIKQNAEGN